MYSSGAPFSKFSVNTWISRSPILQFSITLICGSKASILEFNAIRSHAVIYIAHVVKKWKEGDRYIERKQSNVRQKREVKENKKERKKEKERKRKKKKEKERKKKKSKRK